MFAVVLPIGIGLAMDAVAVSISNGMCISDLKARKAMSMALAFGLAQGIMPVIGFLAGTLFSGAIRAVDHWIALVLLSVIGLKMIVEAVRDLRHPEACPVGRDIPAKTILVQAIATSIDALAVGISLAALNYDILASAGIIAGVTFLLCLVAVYIGKLFGDSLKEKAEILGGIILVAIAVKIVVSHLMGGI